MSAELVEVVKILLGAIAVGTAIALAVYFRAPGERRDLLARTISWYPVCLIIMGGLALGRGVFTALCMLVGVRAVFEFLRATRPRYGRAVELMAVGVVGFSYGLALGGAWLGALMVVPVMGALMVVPVMLGEGTKGFVWRAGMLVLWVLLGGWGLLMVPLIGALPLGLEEGGWASLVFFLVVVTQMNDLFQYVWGKLLGRRALAGEISPNKTWEGVIGAVVTVTVLGGWMGGYITAFGYGESAVLASLFCVGGVLGDLLVSAIKRDLGVKDLGAILPGFGGIMDRVDSLVLNGPAFVFYLLWTSV